MDHCVESDIEEIVAQSARDLLIAVDLAVLAQVIAQQVLVWDIPPVGRGVTPLQQQQKRTALSTQQEQQQRYNFPWHCQTNDKGYRRCRMQQS